MNTVKTDFSALRKFKQQLSELEQHKAHVGLFQETAGRSADKGRIADNPSLGFVHEFGNFSKKIPERSFIRWPLWFGLGPAIQLKDAEDWFKSLRTGGAKRLLAKLGVIAEEVIQSAFESGGALGRKWDALKEDTVRRKDSSAILIESTQLRKAISSRVV